MGYGKAITTLSSELTAKRLSVITILTLKIMNDYDYFVLGVGNSNHPANQCECRVDSSIDKIKDIIEQFEEFVDRVEIDNEEFYDLYHKLLTWKEKN